MRFYAPGYGSTGATFGTTLEGSPCLTYPN
jgi:hypothetical protein